MKKIFSICISFAMLFGLITTSFAQGIDTPQFSRFSSQNFVASSQEFTIKDGVLTKYNGNGGSVTIPNGVIKIGNEAFFACNRLTSVSIPETVTEIGTRAFMATGLTSVTIPNSVRKIGREAFWSCPSLTAVTIGSGVTEMGAVAFEMCNKLTNVTILNGTTIISPNAFRNCRSLTSIIIPASVTQIGEGAFENRDGALYMGTLPNLTIHGAANSYAESYARQNGIRFQADSSTIHVPSTGFTDVPESAFYATPVKWAVGKGITNGTSAYTFSPEQTCSKAQILTFIWRASGEPEPAIRNPFRDVSSSDYYYKAALWAYEQNMVAGSSFLGSTPCSRNIAVTYLWNMSGSPATPVSGQFSDVSSGAPYAQAVAWAVNSGITNGTGERTFSPSSICTRGQIMTFLYRCMVEPMPVNPTLAVPSTPSGSDWSAAYRDFVFNGVFLTAQYPYEFVGMTAWGDEEDHKVMLRDFDSDGIPELMITNGFTGQIDNHSYVYTYTGGRIEYIGNCMAYCSYIPNSSFCGVFCEWHTDYTDHSVSYYAKEGNRIVRQSVYSYNLLDEQSKHQETTNYALFVESQKQMEPLSFQSVSAIRQMGWDNFVAKILG